ncbi:MAG: hypothetical protein HY363_00260 [Candidatus Aenigmarchaeota archaeon]|nr:hypothetical protein [Candidatus Aenigmarchaeota archaeon]
MKLEQKAIIGIIGIVVISILLLYNNSTATGQFSLDVLNKQVKQTQRAMDAVQEQVMQQYPVCCGENKALIDRLSRDVNAMRTEQRTQTAVSGGSGGNSNCCNENRAEIIRLTREVDSLKGEVTSLQRHVQDLEIAESRVVQSSNEPACSNVGAIANQMNCQQACDVSNRRCTRAEMIRIRLSDSQRMPPSPDSCTAALHQNDNTYSYSFSCRCCP